MSVYPVKKKKKWRYEFQYQKKRFTGSGFLTKREAQEAMAEKRKEVKNPQPQPQIQEEIQIDMTFLELVEKRLDYIQAYKTEGYYVETRNMARHWVERWGTLNATDIDKSTIRDFILERRMVSANAANKELRLLRAMFIFAVSEGLLHENPTKGLKPLPQEKNERYVPPQADIDKVISVASEEEADYLWVIRETFARVGEINLLEWKDVDFERGTVTLYTRKKAGGNRTPRRVPMTEKLREVLEKLHQTRNKDMPWVFWHRYWSRKEGGWVSGPYQDRKSLMKKLCAKAEVKYFRFHPIRHAGASLMDNQNAPLGSIQRILGHENRSTTEIYLHSVSPDEREAVEAYEAARKKSHTKSHTKADK